MQDEMKQKERKQTKTDTIKFCRPDRRQVHLHHHFSFLNFYDFNCRHLIIFKLFRLKAEAPINHHQSMSGTFFLFHLPLFLLLSFFLFSFIQLSYVCLPFSSEVYVHVCLCVLFSLGLHRYI